MKSTIFAFASMLSMSVTASPVFVHNANGYSLNPEGELIRFSSMRIEEGRVTALNESVQKVDCEQLRCVDMQQQTLLPGLIDAHGHLMGLGSNLLQVDVRGLESATASAKKVQQYARNNPTLEWITGRGWNQVLWQGKQFPTAAQLDEFVSDRPVWLSRVDGHAGWANSKALALAGISKDTLDPAGGKIVRDEQGNPSGVLIDNAMSLVAAHLPEVDDAYYQASLDAAGKHLLSLGVTSMHDAGISADVYRFYQQRAQEKNLPIRVYAMLSATDPELKAMLEAGWVSDAGEFLSIRSVKAYGDGALGSRGAAMLAPYSDAPHNSGLLVTREEDLKPLFDLVIGHDFQLNYHAIGDRANRLALDQYEDTFSRTEGRKLRNRVEHAQVIAVEDIPRFRTLDIIPSMQPTHATSDMNMAEDRVGKERLKGAYAWQTFLQQGSRIAFGSDFPVELANPFYGLHAAVTRQDRQNQPREGWIPEESVSLKDAFRGFTLDAAYAAHQEQSLGLLTPGYWADFIVVDQDIFEADKRDIWKTRVEQTWLAGEQVFTRAGEK